MLQTIPQTNRIKDIINQIDVALEACKKADQFYGDPKAVQTAISLASSVIDRLSLPNSPYRLQADAIAKFAASFVSDQKRRSLGVDKLAGALSAMRIEFENGFVSTFSELIRSELFTDLLGQAEHLLSEGYKDPAAVIAGGVLEQHIKKLCSKNGIALEAVKKPGQQPKELKLDELNAELVKSGIYNTALQKGITGMIAIRNHAAHGEWSEYNAEQVQGMLSGVNNLIASYPA